MQQRTQIYLEPAQHSALLKEARRLGLSLAGMIRKLVNEHVLRKGADSPSGQERKKAALLLMSLGSSGQTEVSENADEHLARAIHQDVVRDRRPAYARARKKAPRK